MSGETENNISGWTVDTLHSLMLSLLNERDKALVAAMAASEKAIERALAAAEKAVIVRADNAEREFHEHLAQNRHETDLAFIASEKAILKAENAAEKRFESVNEFRAQLSDQATRFYPRTEAEAAISRVNERIAELGEIASTHMTRLEYNSAHERLVEQVRELNDRANRSEGKGLGFSASWIIVLGVIAALGTIVSLFVAFRGG
jgi:vacuolar-type H+-ATPase subunit I/STV1